MMIITVHYSMSNVSSRGQDVVVSGARGLTVMAVRFFSATGTDVPPSLTFSHKHGSATSQGIL